MKVAIGLPMQVKALVAATVLSLSMSAAFAGDDLSNLHLAQEPIKGQYIVVLKEDTASLASETAAMGNAPQVAEVATSLARSHRLDVVHSYQNVLRGFVARADDRALARLLADPRVEFIEEDGVVSITATQNNATWGLDRIDQRNLPLSGTYVYDTGASNVHAYVIDTGIRASHSDFGGRVGSGYSAISDGRGSNDCNGHGTHVAGTVGGTTWGAAKQVRLYPVRVLDCNGSGTNSGVIAGMDWVAGNHTKPAVANMSLGGGASTATDQAVTRMRNAGVTVVVAAGNESQNACNVSPARSTSAITVGSTTSTDARSSFSNYGNCVNIFAPGSSITSAWHTGNTATNTISGTSMAAPHVAGVAALYLADNPAASPSQVENAINSNSTTGVVGNPGSGSPNRMLYSRFDGGGGDPGPGPGPGELGNGVPVTGVSGASGSTQYWTITVPSGATNLQISIAGGSGDADLYVRRGAQPTTSTYDCRPWRNGNNESCTFSAPQAGVYHVMVRGYSSFSGVTLTASYQGGGGGGGGGSQLQNGVPVSGLSGAANSERRYTFNVPAGARNLAIRISGGSGDADLYVRRGAAPTTSSYDCRPYRAGNNEGCTAASPQGGTYHVMVRGYSAYSGVTLTASHD